MVDRTAQALVDFIPLLESGALNDAHSLYITTGEYPSALEDLQDTLKKTGLGSADFDWLSWIEDARPFLQSPETIASARPEELKKLISLAAYAEKFNKSFFPHLCSSGFLLALLRRIQAAQQ